MSAISPRRPWLQWKFPVNPAAVPRGLLFEIFYAQNHRLWLLIITCKDNFYWHTCLTHHSIELLNFLSASMHFKGVDFKFFFFLMNGRRKTWLSSLIIKNQTNEKEKENLQHKQPPIIDISAKFGGSKWHRSLTIKAYVKTPWNRSAAFPRACRLPRPVFFIFCRLPISV